MVESEPGDQRGRRRDIPRSAGVRIVSLGVGYDVIVEACGRQRSQVDLIDGDVRIEQAGKPTDGLIRRRDDLQLLTLLLDGGVLRLRIEKDRLAGEGVPEEIVYREQVLHLALAFLAVSG